MQTFLPYPEFDKSAKSLDMRRLGKQRVECYQILRTLLGISEGWKNHPATRMWRGHEAELLDYTVTICNEWRSRGYKDTVLDKVRTMWSILPVGNTDPEWLGNDNFHRSHRANLVKKLPEHYAPQFGSLAWEPYVWPK